jgi:hypothetical protein
LDKFWIYKSWKDVYSKQVYAIQLVDWWCNIFRWGHGFILHSKEEVIWLWKNTKQIGNWNFIQSSTHMCVEWTFDILKCKWGTIMKCTDCSLHFVPNVVFTCIILHKICILSKDAFDRNWIEELEKSCKID